jgi:hypothetical protein
VPAALAKNFLLFLGERTALETFLFGDRVVGLAFPLITKTFIEHEGQDVVLVVLSRSFPSQDVRRAPEMGFKLLLC